MANVAEGVNRAGGSNALRPNWASLFVSETSTVPGSSWDFPQEWKEGGYGGGTPRPNDTGNNLVFDVFMYLFQLWIPWLYSVI